MDPVRGADSFKMPIESANTGATTQATAHKPPSMHANFLTLSQLTPHSFEALNSLQRHGDETGKALAEFAKDAIQGGFLSVSPNQQQTNVARYGKSVNGNVLVIQARLNERSQYDILSIGIRQASGKIMSMTFPEPADNPGTRKAGTAKALLPGMPVELQRLVMREIFTNENRRQAAYELSAFGVSNKHLKDVLGNDVLLKSEHNAQKKIIGAVNHLSIENLAKVVDTPLFTLASQVRRDACVHYIVDSSNDEILINSLARALEMLKPEQRSYFVRFYLEYDCDGNPDTRNAISSIIGNIGASLHAIPEHHSEIVEAVLQMEDSGKAFVIRGLGEGLDALGVTLRDKLVQATLQLQDEFNLSTAIRGLCDGLSALTVQQRSRVVDAAMLIRSEHEFMFAVVEGFSVGLQVLEPMQQLDLAAAALAVINLEKRAEALCQVGGALANVSGSQYIELLGRLSDGAFSIASEEYRANAIAGLGRGLHLEPELPDSLSEQHSQLIQRLIDEGLAIKDESNKSHAIAGLGGGLHALTAEQKSDVVNGALGMQDEADKSRAIAGLGAGLSALSFEQRERVVNVCLAIEDAEYKSKAIQGLGASLAALTSEQRVKLTDAATTLLDGHKWDAIAALRNIKEPQQFLRLVDAALSLQADGSEGDVSDQLKALGELAARQARVL